MDMRTYWKHNVAEDMQVVEYTAAEQKAMFPNVIVFLVFSKKHHLSLRFASFKRATLSSSVAYFPAGHQSQ